MKRFNLVRSADVSGVSGVGTVACGVTFPDGKTVLWWNTEWHTIGVYANPTELIEIHGHDGATTIEWIDEPYELEVKVYCFSDSDLRPNANNPDPMAHLLDDVEFD